MHAQISHFCHLQNLLNRIGILISQVSPMHALVFSRVLFHFQALLSSIMEEKQGALKVDPWLLEEQKASITAGLLEILTDLQGMKVQNPTALTAMDPVHFTPFQNLPKEFCILKTNLENLSRWNSSNLNYWHVNPQLNKFSLSTTMGPLIHDYFP